MVPRRPPIEGSMASTSGQRQRCFCPYVIEFDDRDATGELRFNAIGLVDGRLLFVTYTMRGDVVRIISARGAEPHEKRTSHEI